jgi:hypothetical protein
MPDSHSIPSARPFAQAGVPARSTRGPETAAAALGFIGSVTAMLVLCLTLLPCEAIADAGRWLTSPSYGELSQELAALKGPLDGPAATLSPDQQQRLTDLTQLEAAIAASDDRSQVVNASGHNLGLFTLTTTSTPGAAPAFGVLASGHESDDDVSVVGLYVPAGVALRWGESGSTAAGTTARVVRLPEGEFLKVGQPAPPSDRAAGPAVPSAAAAAAQATGERHAPLSAAISTPLGGDTLTYTLSLPPLSVQDDLPDLAALPALSQADLDAEPETAPVD